MKKIMLLSFLVGFAGFAVNAQTSRPAPPKSKRLNQMQTQAAHDKMIAEKNRFEADKKNGQTAPMPTREDRLNTAQ